MKKRFGFFPALVALGVLVFVGYIWMFRYPRYSDLQTYPLKYEEEILAASGEYSLDPNLVAAIILCESSFDERAESSVGALGLMQIMPETGEWIANKLGDTFARDALFDPAVNVRYGCWYLRFLDDRFGDDRTAVLAAYNAGHGNVAKWLKDKQYSADGVNLSAIPNSEPRQYVKKVEKAYEGYRRTHDLKAESR